MLAIPDVLVQQIADWRLATREQVLDAFTDPHHPVHAIDGAAFAGELERALAQAPHRIVVQYPDGYPPATAAFLVANLLGGVPETGLGSLEGPVSYVRTGSGPKYDQDWHTDSSPWGVPNRWTVLALLEADPRRPDMATSVIPTGEVFAGWAEADRWLAVLRRDAIRWRETFPDTPPLSAPVVNPGFVRWILPGVEKERGSGSPLGAACAALADHLAGLAGYPAVVAPGRLLVFDNHAVFHHGPRTEGESGRRLLKLKVGGRMSA